MQDAALVPQAPSAVSAVDRLDAPEERAVVSTHVLVAEQQIERLRELSKRTRIAQSEYLREAVDDLLAKYKDEAQR